MTIAWYDPTNHHVSTDKNDPRFTPLGQLWPLDVQQDQMAYLPPEQDPSVTYAPPQRPWVDLTRRQIQDVYFAVLETHRGGHQMQGQLAFGEALQAAIKEKNT